MLALLALLYVLSFIDRFILALLVTPLKAELSLTDVQLGLLFGTYFAIFYGLLGVPFARIADRGNRKRLIIAGVLIWSACTAGSAFAHDYATLALLRFGLAIGEAALTPAAFSMLTDAFPPRRRMLAATLFSAAGMLGASASFVIGAGAIAMSLGLTNIVPLSAWRLTFIAVGVPGVVLVVIFALVAREPARHGATKPAPIGAVLDCLRAHARLYGGLFAGAGAAQMINYAMIAWSPTLVERAFGLSSTAAGPRLGIAQIFSAVGGTLFVPLLLRWIAQRNARLASGIPLVATVLGAASIIVATRMPDFGNFVLMWAVGGFLLVGATNAIIVLIQPIAPPAMRATFTALLLICVSSLGLGIGPPLAAFAAQKVGAGHAARADGLTIVGVLGLLIGAACFALATRPLGLALRELMVSNPPTHVANLEQ